VSELHKSIRTSQERSQHHTGLKPFGTETDHSSKQPNKAGAGSNPRSLADIVKSKGTVAAAEKSPVKLSSGTKSLAELATRK